jgi:hypothetical protein
MLLCASRLGLLAKSYIRWSLQGPGAFAGPFWSRNACNNAMYRAKLVGFSILLSLLRFSLMHQSRGEGYFDAL